MYFSISISKISKLGKGKADVSHDKTYFGNTYIGGQPYLVSIDCTVKLDFKNIFGQCHFGS